jgi:predicted anti-sigma-YlaC factor YlaD
LPAVQGYGHSRRALVIALAVIFVAGCGSASSSSSSTPVSAKTRAYLSSMCTAMAPVISDLGGFQTALANAKSSDLAKYKQNVVLILSALAVHAAKAVAGLEQAGQPDISQGDAMAQGVVAEFTAFHSAFVEAESSAKAIPTINPYQFQLAFGGLVATLGSSLGGAGKAVGALSARLKAPSLAGAEKSVPACATIAR